MWFRLQLRVIAFRPSLNRPDITMSGEKMEQMIKDLDLPKELMLWLTKVGIADPESFALLASKEEEVNVEIVAVAKAQGKV